MVDGQVLQKLFVKPSKADSTGNARLKRMFRRTSSLQSQKANFFPSSDTYTELDVEHDTVSSPDALWHLKPARVRHDPSESRFPGERSSTMYEQSYSMSRNSSNTAPSTAPTTPAATVPSSPRTPATPRMPSGPRLAPESFPRVASMPAILQPWDARSVSTSVIDDYENEDWEPDMQMVDTSVVHKEVPNKKWNNQFRKLIVKGSRYEIRDLDENEMSQELTRSSRAPTHTQKWWIPPTQQQQRIRELPSEHSSRRASGRGHNLQIKQLAEPGEISPYPQLDSAIAMCRKLSRKLVFLSPLERLADISPQMELPVVVAEIFIVMYILYQVSVLVETLALAIRALCLPLIITGKMLGYL